jgi:hypothetical protein
MAYDLLPPLTGYGYCLHPLAATIASWRTKRTQFACRSTIPTANQPASIHCISLPPNTGCGFGEPTGCFAKDGKGVTAFDFPTSKLLLRGRRQGFVQNLLDERESQGDIFLANRKAAKILFQWLIFPGQRTLRRFGYWFILPDLNFSCFRYHP